MAKKERIYAIYHGDEFKFMGNISECSKYLGVDERTVYFYTTPSYKKISENNTKIIEVQTDMQQNIDSMQIKRKYILDPKDPTITTKSHKPSNSASMSNLVFYETPLLERIERLQTENTKLKQQLQVYKEKKYKLKSFIMKQHIFYGQITVDLVELLKILDRCDGE